MDFFFPYFNTNMLGTVISTILSIVLSVYFFKKNSKDAYKPKLPPRVLGGWPLIGHWLALSPPNTPHIVLSDLADKHGPLYTLRLGKHSLLVVNSSDVAKEIFTTNDLIVTYRPTVVSAKIMGYNYASFPFTPGGPYWQQMRRISVSELLSNRRIEKLKYIRVQEVETSIKEMYHASKLGHTVEMKQWLSNLNMSVLLRMVIGKKISNDDRRKFQNAIREWLRLMGVIVLRDVVPFLGWIDLGGYEKRMKKIFEEIDGFFTKWLEEHKMKKKYSTDEDNKDRKDFMDALISLLDGKGIDGYDADTISKSTCLDLIGGYETTTIALTWAVSLLLNNKHVIKNAQEELDMHVGKERIVNDTDMSKLVYLQAIVKESLRLHPPAFILGPRKFVEDCTIAGYHVPKNTWLMINLWKIQKDPNIWTDPMEFKPERFLTTHKGVDVRGLHFELLPFGGGRRQCPATNYGTQMVQFTLARLLQAFDIATIDDKLVDRSVNVGLTNGKATDLEIIASPRLPSYCFE